MVEVFFFFKKKSIVGVFHACFMQNIMQFSGIKRILSTIAFIGPFCPGSLGVRAHLAPTLDTDFCEPLEKAPFLHTTLTSDVFNISFKILFNWEYIKKYIFLIFNVNILKSLKKKLKNLFYKKKST